MAAQIIRQVRPILRAELHLIRTVCKTSEEEQRASHARGEALKLAVDEFAEMQVKAQQGSIVRRCPMSRTRSSRRSPPP
ncbi:MAG: hypothetical protein WKF75_09220 [Singulisphaera sp.]